MNFALALDRFDPAAHQPHPPGYFLYVCLGRLSHLVFQDANTALVAISVLLSCGAGAMIYMLTKAWFGRSAAVFAGLMFVFSPLTWFHGTVALVYIVEAFFSALTGYLCWLVRGGNRRLGLPAAVVVGVAAGFRPSSLLLLAPLLLYSLRRHGRVNVARGTGTLALTVLAWLLPMLSMSGGRAYFSALTSLWLTVPAKGMALNSTPFNTVARAGVMVGIFLLCFGCASVLPLCGTRTENTADLGRTLFTKVWVTPGLLFFAFVFLKFVNSGYLLVLSPPAFAWMGLWASRWYGEWRGRATARVSIVGGAVAFNTLLFLYAPFYCSWNSVRRFERELSGAVAALPGVAPGRDVIIVSFDSHFMGYRHAGYYLPGYTTVQFPEVRLARGLRVFTMRDRDTTLENVLPVKAARDFVIFPLPSGDHEYQAYIAQVLKRFPAGELRTIRSGGLDFLTGPVSDLRYLFRPSTVPVSVAEYGR